MLTAHFQLHELLADCCFHTAITPATLQAHLKHGHPLLVLGTQLAIGCAGNTCMCAFAWEQRTHGNAEMHCWHCSTSSHL